MVYINRTKSLNEEITVTYFEKWKWLSEKWLHKSEKKNFKISVEKKQNTSKTQKHSANGNTR